MRWLLAVATNRRCCCSQLQGAALAQLQVQLTPKFVAAAAGCSVFVLTSPRALRAHAAPAPPLRRTAAAATSPISGWRAPRATLHPSAATTSTTMPGGWVDGRSTATRGYAAPSTTPPQPAQSARACQSAILVLLTAMLCRPPCLCRWHFWYTFAMLLLVPVFLAAGWVHKWRMGLIGLLMPLVVLLQYTW